MKLARERPQIVMGAPIASRPSMFGPICSAMACPMATWATVSAAKAAGFATVRPTLKTALIAAVVVVVEVVVVVLTHTGAVPVNFSVVLSQVNVASALEKPERHFTEHSVSVSAVVGAGLL